MSHVRWKYRCLSHLYANILGYFWIPCPVCHRPFGGHEMGAGALYSPGSMHGQIVCRDPACEAEAEASQHRHWHELGLAVVYDLHTWTMIYGAPGGRLHD